MTDVDPIEDARAEFARVPAPSAEQLAAQRHRLDDAVHPPVPSTARSRRRRSFRRWIPASGLATVGVGAAILVAIALQPSASTDHPRSPSNAHRFRSVTSVPGGAFAGLHLDSASAAEVLRAAGRAAADGVPVAGPTDWTYVRSESGSGDFPVTTMERWTSPDGERSYGVSTVSITNPDHGRVGRTYSVHYEHLADELLGDVQWLQQPDGSYERRANWHDDAGDGGGDVARMVALTRLLRDAHRASDVRDALNASVEGAELEFRDGMACGTDPRYSGCSSSGFVPQAHGLDPAASKRLYLTGQLLTATVSTVFPPDATRAIYDYLATLPEATVAPAAGDSDDVILSLTVKGPSYTTHRIASDGPGVGYETRPVPGSRFNTKAVAAIDPSTGRLVQLGPTPSATDMTVRYTRFGVAAGPGVGSEICRHFADPCTEANDLEDRLEKDPRSRFDGVVDWMFISQFCDGVINRDGSTRQGDHLPRSISNDPKVQADREACERREAKAAAANQELRPSSKIDR